MKEFIEAPKIIYEKAKHENRLIEGLTLEEIKELALRQEGVVSTQFGSVAADSEPTSRSAPKTKNSIDHQFGQEEKKLAKQAIEALSKGNIISLDVIVGDGKSGVTARFLIPEKYANVAYGLKLLFGEPEERVVKNPTYKIIYFTDQAFERNKRFLDVRKKDVTIRLWMGNKIGEQVKICRNTTYLGEGKKGVFQFEDWRVKSIDKEGIFLHAGVRRDHLWVYDYSTRRPELKEIVTAVSGLTATGKTTTLCRKIGRLPGERSEMIGDDGGTFGFDGSYCNFELKGVFVKTENLDERTQPEIYKAATSSEAYLENITLGIYPYIPNFKDLSKTANGRAIVLRENLGIASINIRANKVDNIILLTRNPLMNVISELTHEQATMQFMYGESIESSGGNPAEAGKFKRQLFLDPFIVGDRIKHAMTFYEFLERNPNVRCYLSNTGTIGQDEIKVTLKDSLAVYNDLLRGQLKFSIKTDILGYHYPVKCDRANLDFLRAEPLFKNKKLLRKKVADFLRGRREFLKQIESNSQKIPKHIKNSLRFR